MLLSDAGSEAPRLVADGKGNLCVTYVGGHYSSSGDGKIRVAVQCSSDLGKSFGAPVDVAFATDSEELHHPVGALSATGTLAIAYWVGLNGQDEFSGLRLAVSHDGGKTFAAPTKVPYYQLPPEVGLKAKPKMPAPAWDGGTLWLAYAVADGAGANRLVIDKTCDGGTSWSGPVLLNGPEPTSRRTRAGRGC